jgi:hypothetical protein
VGTNSYHLFRNASVSPHERSCPGPIYLSLEASVADLADLALEAWLLVATVGACLYKRGLHAAVESQDFQEEHCTVVATG